MVMKKISLLFYISAISFILSCSKEKINASPQERKGITIKVVEFGTEAPLVNAEYITSTCANYDFEFGCTSWNEASSFTNTDGQLTARTEDFRNHRIEKTGYWPYIDEPDLNNAWVLVLGYQNYYPAPVAYVGSNSNTNSLLVKLFPVTTITVNIKNVNVPSGGIFTCQTFFNGQSAQSREAVLLPGINTSFQYDVFGAAFNKMFIVRNYPLSDTVAIKAISIAKNEVLSLDFEY